MALTHAQTTYVRLTGNSLLEGLTEGTVQLGKGPKIIQPDAQESKLIP